MGDRAFAHIGTGVVIRLTNDSGIGLQLDAEHQTDPPRGVDERGSIPGWKRLSTPL